ncbi:hypothetical protein ASO20_02740 [Mycoplasma sp. (ex Biomphalaria glabrata)]|uniref:30S ribosomal protein S15 n=1 Tax=Mycoplasma sp. (ex Biomphalaria glabrata) TaxID=1749074 RepID=UPI00073ABBA2|nr:30S ribosomal protein S15 [Mycoplasma sp. (ex Biomphalaria glabrata)]ALV23552.1 hypothetical protein ASO20_02740 [Mycoplasma sp. (ex Biomphalaria glabrata)]
MALNRDKKASVIKKVSGGTKNTGATEVQIALVSEQILALQEHIKTNKKDIRAIRRIVQKNAQRRKMLKYLKHHDLTKYNEIIKAYNLKEVA